MAEESYFPTFEQEDPVLNVSKVESEAQGHEELGKTLASLSSSASSEASTMAENESNAMYVSSLANIDQVKTKAQEQMIQNPWAASKIMESANVQLNSITQSAMVNQSDRSKLKLNVQTAQDEVGLKATETNFKQSQIGAATQFYMNLPALNNTYQDQLISNPAQADKTKEAMLSTVRSLATMGAITPREAGNVVKSMSALVDNVQRLHEALVDPNVSAQQLHTINGTPTNTDKANPNLPIDGSTQWLTDFYNGDKTLQGVLSDVTTFRYPNPQAVMSLSKTDYAHALSSMQGAQVAYGMINSGMPFPALEQKYKELAVQDRNLSYQDQATKDSLKTYLTDLKNGDYLDVIGRTPAGNRLMGNYTQSVSAIQGMDIPDDQKNSLLLQNKNKMVSDAASYGQAHHIPEEYIQPIPNSEIATIKNAFVAGQDPSQVINILGQYNKQNQLYVADAMKNPEQKMVVQGVALSGANIDPQDKLNFIAANQSGRTFPNLPDQDTHQDKAIKARIAASLAPQMRILQSSYDPQTASLLQSGMLSSTLKYTKFLAQQDLGENEGEISGSAWNGYADKAVQIYQNAYMPMTGTNYHVNSNMLSRPLTGTQLDQLSSYVINQTQTKLKAAASPDVYESAASRLPLQMSLSSTGNIQVTDGSGGVYYSEPYTTKMQTAAALYAADLAKQKTLLIPNYFKASASNKSLANLISGSRK